jgi:hypothetical protein
MRSLQQMQFDQTQHVMTQIPNYRQVAAGDIAVLQENQGAAVLGQSKRTPNYPEVLGPQEALCKTLHTHDCQSLLPLLTLHFPAFRTFSNLRYWHSSDRPLYSYHSRHRVHPYHHIPTP